MLVVLDEPAVGDQWIAAKNRLVLRRRLDEVAGLVELRAQRHERVLELVPGVLVDPLEREVGRRIGRYRYRLMRARVDVGVLSGIGADNRRRVTVRVDAFQPAKTEHVVKGSIFEHQYEDVLDFRSRSAVAEEPAKQLRQAEEHASESVPGYADKRKYPGERDAHRDDDPGEGDTDPLRHPVPSLADPVGDPVPGPAEEAGDAIPGRIPVAFGPAGALVRALVSPLRTLVCPFVSPLRAGLLSLRGPVLAGDNAQGDPLSARRHGSPPACDGRVGRANAGAARV